MGRADAVFSTRPDYDTPEGQGETRFEVDTSLVVRKVRNHNLRPSDFCQDPIRDLVWEMLAVNSRCLHMAVFLNGHAYSMVKDFIETGIERHRDKDPPGYASHRGRIESGPAMNCQADLRSGLVDRGVGRWFEAPVGDPVLCEIADRIGADGVYQRVIRQFYVGKRPWFARSQFNQTQKLQRALRYRRVLMQLG